MGFDDDNETLQHVQETLFWGALYMLVALMAVLVVTWHYGRFAEKLLQIAERPSSPVMMRPAVMKQLPLPMDMTGGHS